MNPAASYHERLIKYLKTIFLKVFLIARWARLDFPNELILKSMDDSVDYAYKSMGDAIYFSKRNDMWEHAIKVKGLKATEATVLEFGVFKGESINAISELLPSATIYGFDSFLGLPEDWVGGMSAMAKGAFN